MVPIEITFKNDTVEIQDSDGWVYEYNFDKYQIKSMQNRLHKPDTGCDECVSCSGC